jgi:hypothetical protein
MSVLAMDGDNTEGYVRRSIATRETSVLDDRIDPFCHSLQTL